LLTNANLFVDGDGSVPCIYYLCSRTSGFDDEKATLHMPTVAVAVVAVAVVGVGVGVD
jgi:hypothetical protein